jgi:hypothetical protein
MHCARSTLISAVLIPIRQCFFKTLLKLGKSLPDELQLMSDFAEDDMKLYQVWAAQITILADSALLPC